jgi:hypothetical protein
MTQTMLADALGISFQQSRTAKQCLSWAESASEPENREAFFALAATWISAAARIEHAARIERSIAAPLPRSAPSRLPTGSHAGAAALATPRAMRAIRAD